MRTLKSKRFPYTKSNQNWLHKPDLVSRVKVKALSTLLYCHRLPPIRKIIKTSMFASPKKINFWTKSTPALIAKVFLNDHHANSKSFKQKYLSMTWNQKKLIIMTDKNSNNIAIQESGVILNPSFNFIFYFPSAHPSSTKYHRHH